MSRSIRFLPVLPMLAACTAGEGSRASSGPARLAVLPRVEAPASLSPLVGRLTGAGAEWRVAREAGDSVGIVLGDSAVRLRLWPAMTAAGEAPQDVCGAVALGRVLARADSVMLPTDSAAPTLGVRALGDADRLGTRWIRPGSQAQYHFEGVTRDGLHRVSFRWPVRADPAIRIPTGAPDSLIEAALTPSPDSLDAFMLQVASRDRSDPAPAAVSDVAPRQADAVPLVSDLPFYVVPLSRACPTATFRLHVLARTDQRVRVPVNAGDEIDAFASAEYGAVQVWFEEAGPPETSERFATIPRARVMATADGVVTAHLTLLTVSKQQRPDQEVLLRLTRRPPTR